VRGGEGGPLGRSPVQRDLSSSHMGMRDSISCSLGLAFSSRVRTSCSFACPVFTYCLLILAASPKLSCPSERRQSARFLNVVSSHLEFGCVIPETTSRTLLK